MHSVEHEVTEEAIARRAYEIWHARGCPDGDGTEDWEAAVAELSSGSDYQNGVAAGGLLAWLKRWRGSLSSSNL